MEKRIKTKKFLQDQLFNLYKQGHGRKKERDIHNGDALIHSHSTYMTYSQQCRQFGAWAHEHGLTDPQAAREALPEYIAELQAAGKSAWTIYTALCAMCKAYQISTEEVGITLPKRKRADIKRSRNHVENDLHFNVEKNKPLITFCECFGLRKGKELATLTARDIFQKDGRIYAHVVGKGGRERYAPFCGSDKELKVCMGLIERAGDGLIFPKLPSNFDAHYYRSVYACRIYNMFSRQQIPDKDRYICRKDKKGIVYDRNALRIASQALGHNRADVVANNYLYNLKIGL